MPTPLMNLFGAVGGDWTGAYGGRPMVPSPTSTAWGALGGNLQNLGRIYGLGGSVNQFNTAQAAGQYAANLPGYSSMLAQSSANIGRRLAGDVSDMFPDLAQYAAERGVSTGQAEPSANTNAALLRALGLSKYQVQREAEGDLTQAIGRTPTAPLFNVADFLVTPEQMQGAQTAANLYASGPVPQLAALQQQADLLRGLQAGQTGGRATGGWNTGSSITHIPSMAGGGTPWWA